MPVVVETGPGPTLRGQLRAWKRRSLRSLGSVPVESFNRVAGRLVFERTPPRGRLFGAGRWQGDSECCETSVSAARSFERGLDGWRLARS
jgi:hypothetical protein